MDRAPWSKRTRCRWYLLSAGGVQCRRCRHGRETSMCLLRMRFHRHFGCCGSRLSNYFGDYQREIVPTHPLPERRAAGGRGRRRCCWAAAPSSYWAKTGKDAKPARQQLLAIPFFTTRTSSTSTCKATCAKNNELEGRVGRSTVDGWRCVRHERRKDSR